MLIQRPFNKKTAYQFSRHLYQERGDFIHYQPLCTGSLAKINGEPMCCLLGEMHEYFVGKPIYEGFPHNPHFPECLADSTFRVLAKDGTVVQRIGELSVRQPRWSRSEVEDAVERLVLVNDGLLPENREPYAIRRKCLTVQQYIKRARVCAVAVRALADKYLA